MTDKTDEKPNIDRPWLFQPGKPSANPKGRPKGTFSLKTFAKKYLEKMNDEEKLAFMAGLPKDVIWKMAEGNPEQKSDVTSDGKPIISIDPIVAAKLNLDATSRKPKGGS